MTYAGEPAPLIVRSLAACRHVSDPDRVARIVLRAERNRVASRLTPEDALFALAHRVTVPGGSREVVCMAWFPDSITVLFAPSQEALWRFEGRFPRLAAEGTGDQRHRTADGWWHAGEREAVEPELELGKDGWEQTHFLEEFVEKNGRLVDELRREMGDHETAVFVHAPAYRERFGGSPDQPPQLRPLIDAAVRCPSQRCVCGSGGWNRYIPEPPETGLAAVPAMDRSPIPQTEN